MYDIFNDANEITIKDIEDFLNGDGAVTSTADESGVQTEEGSPVTQPNEEGSTQTEEKPPVTETQAFAHRLKEATNKARNEERESIAKSLGYESYADMQKKRETEMLIEKGLDPEDVSPVVEQLVKKRLEEDPRMQELDAIRQERVNAWAQKELTELKELTGGRISRMEDIPKDVLELWKTKGSLKKAYLELQGESLIREMQNGVQVGQSRGSTGHMASPQGTPSPIGTAGKRPFTAEEKRIYKLFNPDVTDEELSKMTKDK